MNQRALVVIFMLAVLSPSGSLAQDKGSVDAKPLPPLANPNDPKIGAKELFGRKVLPAAMPTRVIGFYAKGCIAGAEALPINGDTWQVMRLSRNRNWAHPELVALLERLAAKAHKDAGWPGILVGDMSQPRGGPMFTGHASHQVGLDADIWLTPMPDRELSRNEREEMSAVDDGARRPARRRSASLDAGPSRGDPRRGAGAERAAHLRQRRDQEGAVPRGQGRPRLALQGAADVRPRLSLPYPHQMPARQRRMRKPADAKGRAKAAAPAISPTGSRIRCCIQSRPKQPPKPKPPMTLGAVAGRLPRQVLRAPDAKR